MTREEAIEVLRKLPIGLMDLSYKQKSDLIEALNIALAALRGQTAATNAIPVMDGFDMIGKDEKRTLEDFSDQEIIYEMVRRVKNDRISVKVSADKSGVDIDFEVED